MTPNSPLFHSFWMAGFECSTHINSAGTRLDMTAAVEHDRFCADDYRRLPVFVWMVLVTAALALFALPSLTGVLWKWAPAGSAVSESRTRCSLT